MRSPSRAHPRMRQSAGSTSGTVRHPPTGKQVKTSEDRGTLIQR